MKQNFNQMIMLCLMLIITSALTGCNDGTLFLSQAQEIQLGKDAADAFGGRIYVSITGVIMNSRLMSGV